MADKWPSTTLDKLLVNGGLAVLALGLIMLLLTVEDSRPPTGTTASPVANGIRVGLHVLGIAMLVGAGIRYIVGMESKKRGPD